MKPEERIETKLMIVIGKLLETAQYIDSIHTFWYFTEGKLFKTAISEAIMFPRTYHLVARRLLVSFAGSWSI